MLILCSHNFDAIFTNIFNYVAYLHETESVRNAQEMFIQR